MGRSCLEEPHIIGLFPAWEGHDLKQSTGNSMWSMIEAPISESEKTTRHQHHWRISLHSCHDGPHDGEDFGYCASWNFTTSRHIKDIFFRLAPALHGEFVCHMKRSNMAFNSERVTYLWWFRFTVLSEFWACSLNSKSHCSSSWSSPIFPKFPRNPMVQSIYGLSFIFPMFSQWFFQYSPIITMSPSCSSRIVKF